MVVTFACRHAARLLNVSPDLFAGQHAGAIHNKWNKCAWYFLGLGDSMKCVDQNGMEVVSFSPFYCVFQ